MDARNMIGTVVGVIVGLIVMSAILFPLSDDNSIKDKVNGTNVGTAYFDKVDGAEISIGLGDDFAVTIDSESVTVNPYDPIVVTDSFMLTRDGENGISICSPIENKFILGSTTGTTFTLTMANGEYTATLGEQTFTGDYTFAIVKSDEPADYLQQNTGTINKDSQGIAYIGVVTWGAQQGVTVLTDLSSGSQNYSLKNYTDFQVTSSVDATLTWEIHNNNNGSYDVSQFADSENTTPITLFIPSNYYTYQDNDVSTLIEIIPLLMTIVLLLGVVAVIARRGE